MLQRRKKYKNRTILGYKNLAVGIINMSQVSFFGERFKKNFDFSPYLVVQYMVCTLYDSVEDGICSAGKKSSANTWL